jgi:hypothetical protein
MQLMPNTLPVTVSRWAVDELGDEPSLSGPYAALLAGASLADVALEMRLAEFATALPFPGGAS